MNKSLKQTLIILCILAYAWGFLVIPLWHHHGEQARAENRSISPNSKFSHLKILTLESSCAVCLRIHTDISTFEGRKEFQLIDVTFFPPVENPLNIHSQKIYPYLLRAPPLA